MREGSTSPPVLQGLGNRRLRDGCQLLEGGAGGAEPWRWRARRVAVQRCRAAKYGLRRLNRFMRRQIKYLIRLVWPSWRAGASPAGGQAKALNLTPGPMRAAAAGEFQPGDWVRVRTLEEIGRTLDADGRCHGCGFMAPMARWCGQRLRVVRRVDRFFDEARGRMVRCRGILLLDGVHCDGSGYPDTRGCDRQCYCFWRSEWVERVSAPEP